MNKIIALNTDSHGLTLQKCKSTTTDEYGTRPGPENIVLIATEADETEESVIIMSKQQAHVLIEQLIKLSGYFKAPGFSNN